MFRIIEVDKGVVPKGKVKLYGSRTFKDYYIEALPDIEAYKDCKTEADKELYFDWKKKFIEQSKRLNKKDDFVITKDTLIKD